MTQQQEVQLNYSTITHPNLNNNKPTNLYFFFSAREAAMQFEEIFINQYYKKGRIKKNMVIVDIGAAMGLSALYFKDYAKQIYAFEPVHEVFASAVRNTQDYKNITCFPYAVGYKTQQRLLYGYGDAPPSTIEQRDDAVSQVAVDFIGIAEVFSENNLDHIDLLKIDCEGSEYEIFSSLSFAKIADKIDYIIGEAHTLDPLMPYFIPEMLKEYGFEVEWLPFNNLYKQVNMMREDGTQKEYKSYQQTMFFAKRKGVVN